MGQRGGGLAPPPPPEGPIKAAEPGPQTPQQVLHPTAGQPARQHDGPEHTGPGRLPPAPPPGQPGWWLCSPARGESPQGVGPRWPGPESQVGGTAEGSWRPLGTELRAGGGGDGWLPEDKRPKDRTGGLELVPQIPSVCSVLSPFLVSGDHAANKVDEKRVLLSWSSCPSRGIHPSTMKTGIG